MQVRRLVAACFAAAVVSAGLSFSPALATPSDDKPVKVGQFCEQEEAEKGQTWFTEDGSKTDHDVICKAVKDSDGKTRYRWVKIDDDKEPSPEPTDDPGDKFKFGPDKIKLSTNVVRPGGSIKITVTCPTTVTIKGNGFTQSPLEVTEVDDMTHTATGVYRKQLPDVVSFVVVCKGHGSVKYSTKTPGGDGGSMEPRTPKIPRGRIDTGDGSYGTFALNGR